MIESLSIRTAVVDDIDFVIEAIFESEKSSSQVISSCKIFSLSEEQFKEILIDVLKQDIPNYDYFLSGFLIAERDGMRIGALGSWLESADGTPSGIIKATILFPYLDKNTIKNLNKNTKVIKGLTINREVGALQLEHGYVRPEFRRHGVFTRLIKEHVIKYTQKNDSIEKVQGIIFKENYKSYQAHLKVGYKVIEERIVDDPAIFNFFPFNTKVLVELDRETFSKFRV